MAIAIFHYDFFVPITRGFLCWLYDIPDKSADITYNDTSQMSTSLSKKSKSEETEVINSYLFNQFTPVAHICHLY